MKTHWYIILITILIGAGMYYYFGVSNNKYDQIILNNDNIDDYKIYLSDYTDTIYFKDGKFYGNNHQEFKPYIVPATGKLSCTLAVKNTIVVTYKDKWFYDIPLTKTESGTGYKVNINVVEEDDESKYLETVLKYKIKPYLIMNGYMMPMYDNFEMWIKDNQYRNIRVIEDIIEDSTIVADSTQLTL